MNWDVAISGTAEKQKTGDAEEAQPGLGVASLAVFRNSEVPAPASWDKSAQ
jgi:hypothetical protein